MKTAIFALATLLATSGIAFAGNTAKTDAAACTTGQIQSGKLDCASTGSIGTVSTDDTNAPAKPKLGYEGDPWVVPTFN